MQTSDDLVADGRVCVDDLGDQLRRLQDAVPLTHAPEEVVARAAAAMRDAADLLDEYRYVAERDKYHGDYKREPGSFTLVPPIGAHDVQDDELTTTTRLGNFYLGSNGAAHGGALPMIFEDVFGRYATRVGGVCRAAYLHAEYRNVTPIDVDLIVKARITSTEGRKMFLTGELLNGDVVVAEANALFVRLREGAP